MKPIVMVAAAILLARFGYGAETNSPTVVIEMGAGALTTQQQKEFVKKLAALPVGASRDVVLKVLGEPTGNDTNSAMWLYQWPVPGTYPGVILTFGTNGLCKAHVGHGHTPPPPEGPE